MTQSQQVQTLDQNKEWHRALESTEKAFSSSGLDFTQEKIFATQLLMNNSYLLDVAKKDPSSLRLAMFNVSAVGLTLNPNQGLAYLVPRRTSSNEPPKVTLDISYRGLITIGVETGAILWAKAELVYENDQFIYRGPAEKPEHICDPFDLDRGEVRGGYCIAQLPSGGVLVETMSKKDMDKIRDSSEAYKKGFGPWKSWEDQMQLKSIAKRASKWWPKTSPRMATALQILNEENGEGLAVLSKDATANGASALPPPPDREQVSLSTQNMIKHMIDRAVPQEAFEACKELFEQRIKDPLELSFALNELDKAKAESESQMQQQTVVNA